MKKFEKFIKQNEGKLNVFGYTGLNYSGSYIGKHANGNRHLYGFDINGNWFEYVCTYHRSKTILKMLNTGEWWTLPEAIRNNYSTNGYNTRVGIRKYFNRLERIEQIALSHQIIKYGGIDGHKDRVQIRN